MATAKLIVMYPLPKDVKAFEAVYRNEHVPLAVAKLQGKTKIVATKVLGSPQGMPGFYRIAEVHLPTAVVFIGWRFFRYLVRCLLRCEVQCRRTCRRGSSRRLTPLAARSFVPGGGMKSGCPL